MGVCCSKKLNVVHPVQNDRPRSSERATPLRIDNLSPVTIVFGRHERTLKARQHHTFDSHTMTKPTVSSGTPWKDNKFPFVIDQDKKEKQVKLSWKRPTEYAAAMRLFDTTTDRYSVKQGQVSDCFFMSTLSSIADHPEYIKQIIPPDAYETDPGKYSGVFHCRFWWMGEWIDVYTDDLLPYNEDIDRVYGAHSEDNDVIWVPLIEKALARLCGGYKEVSGDQHNAYVLMTGGLVEKLNVIKREDNDEVHPPDSVFARVQQALNSGSTVLTRIDEKEANSSHLKGLVVRHAYAVNAALQIQHNSGTTKLLKIRNPWGQTSKTKPINANGDWKGRWSYGSSEWNDVSDDLRKKHNVKIDRAGEFWVCMEDFCRIFDCVYIADTIPHFDEEGFRKADQLNNVINILGEWHGVTAAGNQEKNKIRNPRFIITIPGENSARTMCVVIEITRQFENPTSSTDDKDKLFGVIDIYKIEKEEVRGNRSWMSLNKQTVDKSNTGSRTTTYLCKLSSGDHLLVPYYYDKYAESPVSKSFCIRIFTKVNVSCSQMNDFPVAFYGAWNHPFGDKDEVACVLNTCIFGEWEGEMAAGHTKDKMKNPKFIFTVPDINRTGKQATLLLHLRCSLDVSQVPTSDVDVFKVEKDEVIDEQLWRTMKQIPKKAKSRFVGNYLFKYDLMPGNYILLPFFYDKEALSCEFCIRVLSSTQVQCRHQFENPTMFVRKDEDSLEYENQNFKLDKVDIVFGEWVKNRTAGGNIRNNSFCRNPQFGLSLTGNCNQPVVIALLQESIEPIHAVGCYICQLDEDEHMPVGREVIRCNERMKTLDGKTHPYMRSSEAIGRYMLPPGRYLVLVYAEKPTDEKRFALVVVTQAQSNIRLTKSK